MNGIRVNPKKRTVRAEAGCLLGDVDRETALHGLVMPAGIVLSSFTNILNKQTNKDLVASTCSNDQHFPFLRYCWPYRTVRIGSRGRNWMALQVCSPPSILKLTVI